MRLGPKYRFCRAGEWGLWFLPESWSQALWEEVLQRLNRQPRADHPQTIHLRHPANEGEYSLYLKIYDRSGPAAALKDRFRDSKAVRALKQGEALARQGFSVPPGVAAGERRRSGLLDRAFLLTRAVDAAPLPLFLREHCRGLPDAESLREKRSHIGRLATEVRRLHRCGFVHGDLIPANILVQSTGEREIRFFYIDNDRTRRYPAWLPQGLWKRNLIQLNRFVLPGISLQDRMRFLKSYLDKSSWGRGDRRLIHWLEKKTRKRRWECDCVEGQVSFRELMRWDGPFSNKI